MSLTLVVKIDDDQIRFMKRQGYDLFLAKLVQGQAKANVIWKSKSAYIDSNTFQWQPVFAIAGSEDVKPGAVVSALTKVKSIGYGQLIEINKDGAITDATNPVDPGKPFRITNRDSEADFAAAVYSVDPANPEAELSNPFFISKSLVEDLTLDILPLETVVLWFGAHQETSTVIADYSGDILTVVYGEGESAHTAKWTKAGWQLVH
ncbi:hypothetical protein E1B28_012843 [Marasmius oreades]|uniref:Uncharacterized protein n=1 Tax=Marasmius oreades TaxID=181124 RepID=A0A9P7RT37_9AGAR|nr:uncharacterized protein E1B28_012843 [Marasmius oreades]KAG7088898.1 hypothetical protein E1B28_012843 [Marasmius oreades]